MLRELLVAFLLAASCVVIHAFGIISQFSWFMGMFLRGNAPGILRGVLGVLRLFGILFALHALEVIVWGEFYFLKHCFPDRETAYYFSLTSYTTLGYGDVVIPHPWRLMGGLEAITGVLLFGWSTATLVSFLLYFRESRMKAVALNS